jgi:site-specific DNA-methyltransferase (adenine-specific)
MIDLRQGDVLEELRKIPDGSIDGCLCDPPYGLGPREPTPEEIAEYVLGRGEIDSKGDFMGTNWQIPSVQVWKELHRILRPGAPVLAFSGARTFDLIGIGLRAAGLQRKETLAWLYAEAMPKPATTTDKYIDKHLGATRPIVGSQTLTGNAAVSTKSKGGTVGIGVGVVEPKVIPITAPATEEAKRFEGYGHALRPSFEPILMAVKPLEGTIAESVIQHGVGALNVKGCRLGTAGGTRKVDPERYRTIGVALEGSADGSLNGGTKEALQAGRWPPNVALTHHPECVEVGTKRIKNMGGDISLVAGNSPRKTKAVYGEFGTRGGPWKKHGDESGFETVPVFDCHPDCPVRQLDEQAGDRPSTLTGRADPDSTHDNPGDNGGASSFGGGNSHVYADRGGPSRFMYTSKVSPAEREFGCESLPLKSASDCVDRDEGTVGIENGMAGAGRTGGYRNHHKTLKPISLCKWLATLILPPPRRDGVSRKLLVIYAGAGSEVIGGFRAGWDEILGIEREAEYIAIAHTRIARWSQVPLSMDEGEAVREAEKPDELQVSLFGVGS